MTGASRLIVSRPKESCRSRNWTISEQLTKCGAKRRNRKLVKIWLGRPSGHSIYFTLVGTFETEDKAASAFKKCVKKYGESHVRQKKCEIQIDAEEVWSEDELSSDERRLENYGAVEVEAIENFWDFEVALCLDAPSASEQDLEVLLLLKY